MLLMITRTREKEKTTESFWMSSSKKRTGRKLR